MQVKVISKYSYGLESKYLIYAKMSTFKQLLTQVRNIYKS